MLQVFWINYRLRNCVKYIFNKSVLFPVMHLVDWIEILINNGLVWTYSFTCAFTWSYIFRLLVFGIPPRSGFRSGDLIIIFFSSNFTTRMDALYVDVFRKKIFIQCNKKYTPSTLRKKVDSQKIADCVRTEMNAASHLLLINTLPLVLDP